MAGQSLTVKQERFCQAFIEEGNASAAYRVAYAASGMKGETINRKAKELMDNGKIAARLAELSAGHRQRHDLTVDDLVVELEQSRALALALGQAGAAVAATMGKAKLLGFGKETVALMGNESFAAAIAQATRDAMIGGGGFD